MVTINNCIIKKFVDYGTDDVDQEQINQTILDGIFSNASLIISEGNFGGIDYEG